MIILEPTDKLSTDIDRIKALEYRWIKYIEVQ